MKKILIILIIGLVLINGCIEGINKESYSDELIKKCKEDFDYYRDISETKYNINIKTLAIEKVNNLEEVNNFLEIWATLSLGADMHPDIPSENNPLLRNEEPNFPYVLLANKVTGFEGQISGVTFVTVCDSNGKVMEWSKKGLLQLL